MIFGSAAARNSVPSCELFHVAVVFFVLFFVFLACFREPLWSRSPSVVDDTNEAVCED